MVKTRRGVRQEHFRLDHTCIALRLTNNTNTTSKYVTFTRPHSKKKKPTRKVLERPGWLTSCVAAATKAANNLGRERKRVRGISIGWIE